MLRIVVRGVANYAREDYVYRAMKNILKCSLTEFDKGLEQYNAFRITNKIPDWGVVRLSGIAMSQNRKMEAEQILKEQKSEPVAVLRRERDVIIGPSQVCIAIEKALEKDLDAGFEFYELLLRNKFCTNQDQFASIIVKEAVARLGWNSAIARLEEVSKTSENWEKIKNPKVSVFHILKAAEKENLYEEAENEIAGRRFVRPSVLRKISVLTKLDGDAVADVARYLTQSRLVLIYDMTYSIVSNVGDIISKDNITLTRRDIRLIVKLARKVQSTKLLLCLLDIDGFVKIAPKCHFLIYDEIIKIAANRNALSILEEITSRIESSENLDNEQKFALYWKVRKVYWYLNGKTLERLYIS